MTSSDPAASSSHRGAGVPAACPMGRSEMVFHDMSEAYIDLESDWSGLPAALIPS